MERVWYKATTFVIGESRNLAKHHFVLKKTNRISSWYKLRIYFRLASYFGAHREKKLTNNRHGPKTGTLLNWHTNTICHIISWAAGAAKIPRHVLADLKAARIGIPMALIDI
jgi:hypothetical protein